MRGANLYWRRTGGEHMIGKAARVGNPVMEVRDFGTRPLATIIAYVHNACIKCNLEIDSNGFHHRAKCP